MTRTEYVEKLEDFKRLIDDGTLPYESYPKEIVSLIFSELISDAKSIEPFATVNIDDDKMKELCKDAANNIRKEIESYPEWIYCDHPASTKEEIEMFNKIEEALGFKLFFWQKNYILYGWYRRTGDTTAWALRELLSGCEWPIDFSLQPHSAREKFERQQMLEIKEKLDAAGIETREVL